MADPVQSSNVNDFSKDADVLAAKIEMVKKQVDQLAGSLSSVNSQFTKFSRASNRTYNPKISVSTGSNNTVSSGVNSSSADRIARLRQKEEERIYLATERWKRRQVQEEEKRQQQRADHLQRIANRRAKEQEQLEKEAAKSALKAARESERAQLRAREESKQDEQNIKEEKKLQKDNRKDSKSLYSNLKSFGLSMLSTGLILRQAVQVVKQAFETVVTLGKSTGWMTSGTNNFASVVANTANLESARLTAAKEADALALSFIGTGATGLTADLLELPAKASGAYEDYTNLLMSNYSATANKALIGTGIGGKITDKITKLIVEDTIRQAKNFNPTMRKYSNASIMNTDFFKSLYEQNLGAYTNINMTALRGYLAQTKGYGYAMLDLSPEQKAAYVAEMQGYLTANGITQKQYNDIVKQWTKTGRVIEKFGKNLYAFDEVLTNDPFSNEDVEEINRSTGNIEDKLDDGNDTTKKIGDDIIPPVDDINKTSKETVTVCEEILERLKQMNLDVHVNVPVNVHIPGVNQPETAEPKAEDVIKVPDRLLAFAEQLQAGASSATSPAAILSALSVFQGSGVHSTEPSSDLINTYKEEYKHSLETMLDQMIAYQTILAALSIYDTDNAYIPKNLTTSSADIATIQSLLADVDNVDYAKAIQDGSLLEAISYIQKLTGTYTEGAAAYGKSLDLYQVAAGLQPIYDVLLGGAIASGSIMALTGGAAIAPFIQSLLSPSTIASAFGGAATGAIGTRKMPTLSALFEEGPEMVLPLNAAGADFLATSLNNLGLNNRLTNNSANVNVNLSGINIADNDREWYEVAHKIHNIIEAEQARQGG